MKMTPDNKQKQPINLIFAMERLVLESHNSQLSHSFWNSAMPFTYFMQNEFDLSPTQSVLFSVFVSYSDKGSISMGEVQRWFNLPAISMLKYAADIQALLDRKLICKTAPDRFGHKDGDTYRVPSRIKNQIKNNKLDSAIVIENLDFNGVFSVLAEIFEGGIRTNEYRTIWNQLKELYEANSAVAFCRNMMDLSNRFTKNEVVLLSFICYRYVIMFEKKFDEDTLGELLINEAERKIESSTLFDEDRALHQNGLIEFGNDNGFYETRSILLTYKAKQLLLKESGMDLGEETVSLDGVMAPEDIPAREMFYTAEVHNKLDEFSKLLEKESFINICKRLKESNLRTGFCCLFYGPPGTGKTETALQLARISGRGALAVDFSQLRSKWVGETEKNVRLVFSEYRRKVKNSKNLAPILLFNEADGIIGKRFANVEKESDKMENAVQNIILEEMETLEKGIMIATTNFTASFDSAFERRFIYKVKFENPDKACRKSIWMSMIDNLPEQEAELLSRQYDFSGGQIENITRKYIVDQILFGETGNRLDKLMKYCASERICDSISRKMGFSA